MNVVIFPGTFDPITYGHIDLIQRAIKLFPKVIIAIAENKHKRPFFSLEQRIELCRTTLKNLENVTVIGFNCLLIDLVAQENASAIIRGLRAVSDFEYEFQLATMNRRLAHNFETIFLAPGEQYSFISSSLVKEIATLNGDVTPFVPAIVAQALKEADPLRTK